MSAAQIPVKKVYPKIFIAVELAMENMILGNSISAYNTLKGAFEIALKEWLDTPITREQKVFEIDEVWRLWFDDKAYDEYGLEKYLRDKGYKLIKPKDND